MEEKRKSAGKTSDLHYAYSISNYRCKFNGMDGMFKIFSTAVSIRMVWCVCCVIIFLWNLCIRYSQGTVTCKACESAS